MTEQPTDGARQLAAAIVSDMADMAAMPFDGAAMEDQIYAAIQREAVAPAVKELDKVLLLARAGLLARAWLGVHAGNDVDCLGYITKIDQVRARYRHLLEAE